jgi:gas vesicle protein
MPANDWQMRKQQIYNSSNKLIDPAVNQHIVDLLQEQMKQLKQSLDYIVNHVKHQQLSANETALPATQELPNDTKELQDQVSHMSRIGTRSHCS